MDWNDLWWIGVCAAFALWCWATHHVMSRQKKVSKLLMMAFKVIDELEEPARRGATSQEVWEIAGRLEAFNRQVEVDFPKEFAKAQEEDYREGRGEG
jgi:hypothetical protein